METRALLPGAGFLLSLVFVCLLLVYAQLGHEAETPPVVDVAGWVRVTPGEEPARFYRITAGERLGDLLAAELPQWESVIDGHCSGQRLVAGTEIRLIDGKGTGSVGCSFSPLPERLRYIMGIPMNLNRASAEELALIPGVGPARAEGIVEARARKGGFSCVEDLLSVRGIGAMTLERIRRHATVGLR